MKHRGFIEKVLHFLVHNGIQFTVGVMCFVHVTLLILMLIMDVIPLV
ncbi:MAG: hypothetical protein K6E85_06045 [Lachnospiraceae bacterium]|nr:hypothetical protein [Lachnospiraceae bacterium]